MPFPKPNTSTADLDLDLDLGQKLTEPTSSERSLVLVVDDDDDTRFCYTESLEHLGYRTASACDGAAGVEAAIRLRPNAILMDAAMPVMNGVDATRRIKEDPRTSACLVIFVTGQGNAATFDAARAAGCDAFCRKPFDPIAFDHVLRALSQTESPDLLPPIPPEVVKHCSCGRDLSREQWLHLALCGRLHLTRRGAVIEMRNCTCGSSLALEVETSGDAIAHVSSLPPDQASESAPVESTARTAPKSSPPARKVLYVVDRDVHVRRLVKMFVGDAYDVEFFDDGYAALDRVRQATPVALITEILIPRLDGLALCRLLKGDPVTARVPILVFSMLVAAERSRDSGADAFLAKPLEKTRFMAALRNLTDGGTKQTAATVQVEERVTA